MVAAPIGWNLGRQAAFNGDAYGPIAGASHHARKGGISRMKTALASEQCEMGAIRAGLAY